jgi:hypothetical protein
MLIAAFGFVASLKDISNETVRAYTWWDWTMLISGLGLVMATTWRAFCDQSISISSTPTQPQPQPTIPDKP